VIDLPPNVSKPAFRKKMTHFALRRHARAETDGNKTRLPLVLAVVTTCLLVALIATPRSAADGDDGPKPIAGQVFPPESIEFFESRVRPILVDRCFKCHGEKKQSSGLRLDSREAALKGGDTGPALVAGKPDESLIVQAVAQTHAE